MIDNATIIIDKLEEFAGENKLKFLYSMERKPEGCLTVYFGSRTEDFKGQQSYRINYAERTQKESMEVVNSIIENVKSIFRL